MANTVASNTERAPATAPAVAVILVAHLSEAAGNGRAPLGSARCRATSQRRQLSNGSRRHHHLSPRSNDSSGARRDEAIEDNVISYRRGYFSDGQSAAKGPPRVRFRSGMVMWPVRKVRTPLAILLAALLGGVGLTAVGLSLMAAFAVSVTLLTTAVVILSVPTERLAYWAVGLMLVTITWNGVRVAGHAVVDFLMVVAFACVAVHVMAGRQPVPAPPWLVASGLGLCLSALLTMIFPPSPGLVRNPLIEQLQATPTAITGPIRARSDSSSLFKFEIALIVLPIMVALVATNAKRCARFADLWALSAIVSATVAILDFSGLTHLSLILSGVMNRQSGLTLQPNHLALSCALALPVATLWLSREGRWRAAGLAGIALLLSGVYASGSRAGTVAALVAVVTTVGLVPSLRRALPPLLPVAGIVTVSLLMFTNAASQVVDQVRLNGASQSVAASDQERTFLAGLAINDISARPVYGVGYAVIDDAHDIYLQLLAAGGIIGLASFLVYCGGIVTLGRRVRMGRQRDLAAALGVSVLVWLGNGLVGTQVTDRYIYVPASVLLALSIVPRRETVMATTIERRGVGDCAFSGSGEPRRAPTRA